MVLSVRHIALVLALIFIGISANADVQDSDIEEHSYYADLADSTAVETLLTRDYVGDYIYADGVFERLLTPTGDFTPTDGHRHFLRDHQGNTMAVLKGSEVVQQNNYYPDGTPFSATATNRYLYSGKEFDRMYGLDWYDFHARYYDPVTMTTPTQDPHSEKYYGYSPYSFCAGNPVNFIDPTGMDWVSAQYENHQFYYFFSNINGMSDFNNMFGNQSNFSYLGKEYSLNINDSSFELLADGNISHNGNILDKEYDQNNILIGSDCIVSSVNNNGSPIQNRYGFYFGERNSINKTDKTYSYSKPPVDELDYAAWRHDRAYDKVGAAGPTDALFNSNTAIADGEFLLRSLYSTRGFSNKAFWARGASIMFYYSFMIKTLPFTRSILKIM